MCGGVGGRCKGGWRGVGARLGVWGGGREWSGPNGAQHRLYEWRPVFKGEYRYFCALRRNSSFFFFKILPKILTFVVCRVLNVNPSDNVRDLMTIQKLNYWITFEKHSSEAHMCALTAIL